MKCANCANETPAGDLWCADCGSVVSLLAPGEIAPRLQQIRVVELISNAPTGLLWLAEKTSNHERLLISEYEPKGGGKVFLRDFNVWYQRLRALPVDLLPALDTRYINEERLFLVWDLPSGQSVKNVIESGRTAITGTEFLHRLLILTQQFAQALPGCSHGWIRAETVTVSDSKLLLGPPVFAPGETADPQSDLKECALLSAQWAGILSRTLDGDAELLKQLQKAEDWTLAATIEWILLCKDRAPRSVEQVIEFLHKALSVPKGDSEKDISTALDTLKNLYQQSSSTIVQGRIEQSEERLSKIRRSSKPQPETKVAAAKTPVSVPQTETKSRPEPPPNVESNPKPPSKVAPPPPPPLQPSPKPGGQRKVAWAIAAIVAIIGIYYYVASASMREFNSYIDRQLIVNTNGPSAYEVYEKTLREKGPECSTIKSMNDKALPILQKLSQNAFDSWYKDSELSKPVERTAPGEFVLTTWAEMVQVQEWLAIIEKTPLSNARLAYARGMAALNRHAWEEARQQFEEALRNQANWSLALNGLGKAYTGERRYDMSEKYYLKASEADPSWYFPHSNLGTLYRENLKNFASAEHEYRAAIQLDPNRASFHFNLALLYYKQGKQYWPSACSEFRTALSATGTSLTPSESNVATLRRDKTCQGQ